MSSRHRIVIVGASIAGLTAAENLRLEGFDGQILLLGDEPHLPYNRPPLSKQVLLGQWETDRTLIKSKHELSDLGIEFRGECPALHLDVVSREVVTKSGIESFDDLIIATGTKARQFGVSGVRTLRTIEDAISLRNEAKVSKRMAVIGAGVLGSEIASAARVLGADVLLIGKAPEITFGSVGGALSSQIEKLHIEHGVELRLNNQSLELKTDSEGTTVRLDGGELVTVDSAVAAIGAMPCTDWLDNSALKVEDGIVCDENGKAAPGVYAIGDVAAWPDPETGIVTRIEHQTNAIEQAMSVAGTIVNNRKPVSPIPFFWSELHGVSIKAYGWFDGTELSNLKTDSGFGTLLANQSEKDTTGVISWNSSPKDFRVARSLVDQSSRNTNNQNLIKE